MCFIVLNSHNHKINTLGEIKEKALKIVSFSTTIFLFGPNFINFPPNHMPNKSNCMK